MSNIDKKNITIMVIDDETINLQIVDGILKLENYQSILVADPLKVLEIAKKDLPDIILLDVEMPIKDGFEICSELKNNSTTKTIPVLFLSGRTTTEDIIKGLNSGGVDYITKPFNAPELLARVNTHIKLKSATDKLIEIENIKTLHAAMVSQNHNMNQLTTSILGQIEIGRLLFDKHNKNLNKELEDCFNSIEKAAINMNTIIQKFKDIQTIEYIKYSEKINMLDLDRSSVTEEE